jgi:tetratricopeptide (TPR) repeat protein
VQTGKVQEGVALARSGTGAHAAQARALAAYRSGTWPVALAEAETASGAGRGAPAHFLSGLVRYQMGDLPGARTQFQAALAAEPDDVNALYNLALVADKQDRYGEARTAYLRVLALDPKHKQARHNLGVMAHAIGAESEAKHHLEKLAAVAPGDPLVADLRQVLATPAHPRGPVLSIGSPGSGQDP